MLNFVNRHTLKNDNSKGNREEIVKKITISLSNVDFPIEMISLLGYNKLGKVFNMVVVLMKDESFMLIL